MIVLKCFFFKAKREVIKCDKIKMTNCFIGRKGKAIDGDTIKFYPSINGFRFARLPNINTPEKRQNGYNRAKIDLQRIIQNRPLKICPKAIDRTRLIADVFASGVNVTRAMKSRGW